MVRRKACRYKSHEFEPKDWEALLSESNASKRRTASDTEDEDSDTDSSQEEQDIFNEEVLSGA